MTIRKAIEIEGISYIVFAALLSGIFVWNNNRPSLPILFANTSQTIVALSPVTPRVERASQISPDGSRNLIMEVTDNSDGTLTYSFVTSDSSGSVRNQIYLITVQSSEKYTVPFNAWSPDNKYVFIYKGDANALVFKATGEPITGEELYIDLESVFTAKNTTHTIKEITGWADPALVIFNTLDQNAQKASFWLEVPSKAIIPLSTQF